MKFSVCLVFLVTVWQALAQAPGDENSRCENLLGSYPPFTEMLMDSRNYEQLITGSSAVWQALDVDRAGSGVSGCVVDTIRFYSFNCTCLLENVIYTLFLFLHAVEKLIWWFVCCSAEVM